MPFVSGGHLWMVLIILVVVLIVWGPGKLPDVGSGLGRAIREFKKASSEAKDQVAAVARDEDAAPTPPAAPSPPALTSSGGESRADAASREEHKVAS
jgi:sec-independent protein translocase protein TatA